MKKVFISYRREDTQAVAGRLFDGLEARLGVGSVFFDIDNIALGTDFRTNIRAALDQCGVLLVLIGSKWLETSRNEKRRLDDPGDLVRVEVEAALQRGIPVIPVLIDQTVMPSTDQLPGELSNLAFRNAARLDSGIDFKNHLARLVAGVAPYLAASTLATAPDPIEPGNHVTSTSTDAGIPPDAEQNEHSQLGTAVSAGQATKLNSLESRKTWILVGLAVFGLITLYATFRLLLIDSAEQLVRDMQSIVVPLARPPSSKSVP